MEAYDRRDEDRQDAVTEKRDAYLFVRELQCPNIENAASDMAKQDIKSGKELPIILLFRRWVATLKYT